MPRTVWGMDVRSWAVAAGTSPVKSLASPHLPEYLYIQASILLWASIIYGIDTTAASNIHGFSLTAQQSTQHSLPDGCTGSGSRTTHKRCLFDAPDFRFQAFGGAAAASTSSAAASNLHRVACCCGRCAPALKLELLLHYWHPEAQRRCGPRGRRIRPPPQWRQRIHPGLGGWVLTQHGCTHNLALGLVSGIVGQDRRGRGMMSTMVALST